MAESKLDFRPDYLEWAPREVRQKYLDEALQELIRWAYARAPVMKEKLDSAGVSPDQMELKFDTQKTTTK